MKSQIFFGMGEEKIGKIHLRKFDFVKKRVILALQKIFLGVSYEQRK